MHIIERLLDICYFLENQREKNVEKKSKVIKHAKNILTD